MLRINLLHDDREDALADVPAPHTALILLAGILVLLLCGGIALLGWLTLQAADENTREEIAETQEALEALQQRTTPADYRGLVELEQHALTLEALTQHQSRTPRALKSVLSALHFDDRRGDNVVLRAFDFDGQRITATGTAESMDTLADALTTFSKEDALQDARFTSLSVAEEPLSGRARRYAVNAVHFSFYATIAAPPMEAQE